MHRACSGCRYRYEGDFVKGKKEGHGIYKDAGGRMYSGAWKGGLQEGHGKFVWGDGTLYEGESRTAAAPACSRAPSSYGRYEGEFKAGKYHGKGCQRFASGDVYVPRD
jgi:hypothetical protein